MNINLDRYIADKLKLLRLSGMLETLPVRIKQAEDSNSGYIEFLQSLLEDEYERRQSGKLLKRLRKAGFEEEKTLEGFDFSFNPQIPSKRIKDIANCSFIDRRENIFLLGPVGVGKTHIAQALAHIACRMEYDVLFVKASKMFRNINIGRADGSHEKRIKQYTSACLLVIDDFGLKPLTPIQSDDFYEIINERYMKRSTIFTSNRAIEDWHLLFTDPVIGNSAMDRIAHNAHQIVITGESYRNKGKKIPGTQAGKKVDKGSKPS